MPRLNENVIPNQRSFQSSNDFRDAVDSRRAAVNFRRAVSPPSRYERANLRPAEHVIPNQRNSHVQNARVYPSRIYHTPQRTPLYVDNCNGRRYTHVQTGSRNVNLSIREMGYLPFIGTIIGIFHVAYGLFSILHFDSRYVLDGFSWCGRGLVEMIPFVGGFSLYIYDHKFT